MCGDAIVIVWFPQRRGNTGEKAVLEPFQTGNMLKIGTQTKQALKEFHHLKDWSIFVDGKLPPGVLLFISLEEKSILS